MKIKRYLGKDTQEALLKVKMDLGNNAIILNTKKVRQRGIKKYFAKPMVEIMAAIDDDSSRTRELEVAKVEQSTTSERVLDKNKLSQKEEKFTELENKVNNIESMIGRLLDAVKPGDGRSTLQLENDSRQMPNVFQLLYNNLLKNEVDPELAQKIIDQVTKKSSTRSVNDAALAMYSVISSLFGRAEPIRLRSDGKPTVILFVGPTGVGKTTTLAKLAANFMLANKKKVGLITADTYRIAAVDQLKTYAEILGIPLSIAYTISEIGTEIEKYGDKDVILIDTAGCSQRM